MASDNFIDVIQRIQDGQSLEKISLEGALIGDDGIKTLVEQLLKKNCRLVSLSLVGNDIEDEGAKYIAQLVKESSTMTYLCLNNNYIRNEGAKYLADAIKQTSILLELQMNKNPLFMVEGVKYLAEGLQKNTSVTSLSLRDNWIGGEGANYLAAMLKTNTALRVIDLSRCNIRCEGAKFLADGLANNTFIVEIYLCAISLKDDGAQQLAQALERNKTIRTIHLSGNEIGMEGIKCLASMLETNTSLIEVFLGYNPYGDDGAKYLGQMFEKNSTLKKINLECIKIGDNGIKDIVQGLEKNFGIEQIDFFENKITAETADCIIGLLKQNPRIKSFTYEMKVSAEHRGQAYRRADHLRYMCDNSALVKSFLKSIEEVLSQNNLTISPSEELSSTLDVKVPFQVSKTGPIGPEGMKILIHRIENEPNLLQLDLSNMTIRDEGVKRLLEAFKKGNQIKKLDLSSNYITSEGFRCLTEMLEANTTIIEINLEGNFCREEGARFFSQIFEKNKTIKDINLSANGIGVNGAKYITESLENNLTVTRFSFEKNRVDYEGAKYFADMLEKNQTIQWIDLSDNPIGNIGLKHLALMLEKNNTLLEMKLASCGITDKGAQLLIQVLENNLKAVKINISGTIVTYDLEKKIKNLYVQNTLKVVNQLLEKAARLEETTASADKAAAELDQTSPIAAEFISRLKKAKEDKSALVSKIKETLESDKNKESSAILSITAQVDQMQELLQKLQGEIIECKADMKQMNNALEDGGVYARIEVAKGFKELEDKDSELYIYCKTFYWTTLNLFAAYRQLSTGVVQGNLDNQTNTKEKMFVLGAQKAAKYGAEIAKGIPFVGGIIGALDSIISSIYEKTKQNRLENKTNAVNKIIQDKFGLEEDMSPNIGKLAIAMTKAREQAILYPEAEIPSGISSRVAWLKEKIIAIKDSILPSVELHDRDSNAATLALEDVSLFMAYLCLNFEAVIKRKAPLDQQCADIIKYNCLEKLLAEPVNGTGQISSEQMQQFDSYQVGAKGPQESQLGCVDKFRQSGCDLF